MSETLAIYCTNLKEYVNVKGGETVGDIYARIADRLGFEAICARVNNKTEGMTFRLFMPKMVEFLPLKSPSGSRVYVRSLCMMLYKAVQQLFPGTRLKIEHSLSRGYFCRLFNMPRGTRMSVETVAQIKDEMKRLADSDIPFVRHECLMKHAIEQFEKQGLTDKVLLLSTLHDLYTDYYTLGDLADNYYAALAPRTGMLKVFDLIPYEDGMLLMGPDMNNPDIPQQPLTQHKMYVAFTDHLKFNHIVGVTNVGELNKAVAKKDSPMLINVSEALHSKRIANIADMITTRFHEGGARIVLVAGPSSSGKTTFTKRLAIELITNLLKPKMISLDDYFVDRDKTPLDENGELDYESLYSLDLKLFNEHLATLIAGGEVDLPTYNFAKGMREYKGNKLHLDPDNILLIEGIHGLNPELTASIPANMKFKVYVSALTTINIDDHNWIPTTDNRLLRRIIRDYKYRGASAVDTIRRWPSVRRGEERWIFPYQENADATFNSSLLFELGVLKLRGESILMHVPRDVKEYAEAYRLRKFLSYFAPISEEYIPSTSLLREFMGGSSFKY